MFGLLEIKKVDISTVHLPLCFIHSLNQNPNQCKVLTINTGGTNYTRKKNKK